MIDEQAKWDQVPEEVIKRTVRTYKGVEVVSRIELTILLNVSDKTLQRHTKAGIPKCEELSRRGFQVYYLESCREWIDVNVNKAKSKLSMSPERRVILEKSIIDNGGDDEEKDADHISYDEAERREKVAKARLAEIKLKEAEGIVVLAEDLDKAMYEQAIMHKTDKSNDEKILPILLEMKTTDEIRELLIDHNDDRLELLDSQIKQKFKKEKSNYDVFEAVLQAIRKGSTPKDLIEGMK